LIAESDGFLILPGGVGTLEEIFDVLSRNRLGLQKKPVAFLNIDGFWDPLFKLMRKTEDEGFTPQGFSDGVLVESDPKTAVAHLLEALEANRDESQGAEQLNF
ncbi:MAG TPA: TIGR00730 family Rossman fold protein, partial [Alphaproteobacteria bacterium]|nr:TIGR00730 family Rossman fold protein [Alphaproteobacteria bacterium]